MKPIILVLLAVVFQLKASNADDLSCPNIRHLFPRHRWAARQPRDVTKVQNFQSPPTTILIHHSNSAPCVSHSSCSIRMRGLQSAHFVDGNNDVNTNFAVGGNGMVYEGRGWTVQTQTRDDLNARVFAITLLGNFQDTLPSQPQMNALRLLVECGIGRGAISREYRFIGHRQTSMTPCPGDALFQYMQSWPRFDANPLQ